MGVVALITAAPAIFTAATVGALIYAGGVTVCGLTAFACGGSIVGEAITGKNPIKDAIGPDNFALLTYVATMGCAQGIVDIRTASPSYSTDKGTTNEGMAQGELHHIASDKSIKSGFTGV